MSLRGVCAARAGSVGRVCAVNRRAEVGLFQNGRRDDAIEHFREAVRLKPDYQQAQRALQIVLAGDPATSEPNPSQ